MTHPDVVAASTQKIGSKTTVILMQTAQVVGEGENGNHQKIRVMLDTGSNQSFIRTDAANTLKCRQLSRDDMKVQSFGGGVMQQKMKKVQVTLIGPNAGRKPLVIAAYEVPEICCSPPRAAPDVKRYSHLVGLDLAEPVTMEDDDMPVSVLIGLDYMCEVLDGRMKRGDSGPVALGSRFGWILSGPAEVREETARTVTDGTAISNFVRAEKTCDALQDLWELEGIGISSEGADLRNQKDQEDREVMGHFQSTLQRLPDGRYQVRWPRKEPDYSSLPTNEGLARARLTACEKSLNKNGRLAQYDDAVQDYLEQGQAGNRPYRSRRSIALAASSRGLQARQSARCFRCQCRGTKVTERQHPRWSEPDSAYDRAAPSFSLQKCSVCG